MSPTAPTRDDHAGSSGPAPTIPPARCGTTLLTVQAMRFPEDAGQRRNANVETARMIVADPDLRARAATALEALATNTCADRDDITAAILVIDAEAERLGDHGLEALCEQLRVIALLDNPRADDTIRPTLGRLAASLRER